MAEPLTELSLMDALEEVFAIVGDQVMPNKIIMRRSVLCRLRREIKRVLGVRVLGATVRFQRSRYEVRR